MSATVTCSTPQGRDVTFEMSALLSPAAREQIRADANAWIKSLRLVSYGGESMRARFRYRSDSLWWFTELYLHKMRQLDTAIATVLALESVREDQSPTRMTVHSPDPTVRAAAEAFGRANRRIFIRSAYWLHGVPWRTSQIKASSTASHLVLFTGFAGRCRGGSFRCSAGAKPVHRILGVSNRPMARDTPDVGFCDSRSRLMDLC